jgi:hypothetical protein
MMASLAFRIGSVVCLAWSITWYRIDGYDLQTFLQQSQEYDAAFSDLIIQGLRVSEIWLRAI